MTTYKKKKLKDREGNYIVTPSSADMVYCQDGNTVEQKLNNIENDEFSPTITQIESMAKVGVGTDVDVSANVQEGYVKSAILKGNTLVNLCVDASEKTIGYSSSTSSKYDYRETLKPNTTYTILFKISDFDESAGSVIEVSLNSGYKTYKTISNNGRHSITFTTQSDTTNYTSLWFYFLGASTITGKSSDIIVLEGDYANLDVPFFTGIQSVKMPVLTTTGKNLFDEKWEEGALNPTDGSEKWQANSLRSDYIKVAPSKTYVLNKNAFIYFYDENKKFIRCNDNVTPINAGTPFDSKENERFIRFFKGSTGIENAQLELGKVCTQYEPYKSNILSCNEEVTLRGIGDVKDTLDGNTGELIQRIGEVVLDGSEDEEWKPTRNITIDGVACMHMHLKSLPIPPINNVGATAIPKIICDKGVTDPFNGIWMGKTIKTLSVRADFGDGINYLCMNFPVNEDIKTWLSENPMKVQYILETPIIKTVDLTPGGTNPTTKPYVWDGAHIQLSSEEGSLTPSLEYSVTTSRGGQIIQNTQSIAKQDKRVYDLEMLLINASIDEAYKRLTLQNDVMVMNRECQTVASPLRYIMLQRLIEEKAYETQDMLDKLDVFFMYGEITDEQYFELFDIVLGIMTDTDLDITEEVE